jgi:hypothetical protein
VPWTHAGQDQYLRDGYSVLITNKKTHGYVVADIGKRTLAIEEAFMPTVTTQHPGPVTRSVFVIKKVEKADIFGADDLIRYGQKIKIEVNPYLYRKPLWLSSGPLGPNLYSPVTRNQEASLTTKDVAYNNTWIVDSLDPNFRFEK